MEQGAEELAEPANAADGHASRPTPIRTGGPVPAPCSVDYSPPSPVDWRGFFVLRLG